MIQAANSATLDDSLSVKHKQEHRIFPFLTSSQILSSDQRGTHKEPSIFGKLNSPTNENHQC